MSLDPKKLLELAEAASQKVVIAAELEKFGFAPNPLAMPQQPPVPGMGGGAPMPIPGGAPPMPAPQPPMGGAPPMPPIGAPGQGGGQPLAAGGGGQQEQAAQLDAMFRENPEQAVDMLIQQSTAAGLPLEQVIQIIKTQVVQQLRNEGLNEQADAVVKHLEAKYENKGGETPAPAGSGSEQPTPGMPEDTGMGPETPMGTPPEPGPDGAEVMGIGAPGEVSPEPGMEAGAPTGEMGGEVGRADIEEIAGQMDGMRRALKMTSQQVGVLTNVVTSLVDLLQQALGVAPEEMEAAQGEMEAGLPAGEEAGVEPGAGAGGLDTEDATSLMQEIRADKNLMDLINKLNLA